jgi:hypothetical protein
LLAPHQFRTADVTEELTQSCPRAA